MTEKLYYFDGHIDDFTAHVISCSPVDSGFAVVLDRTAFFPEGGGQPSDTGTLGGQKLLDLYERDDDVIHVVSAPIAPETLVRGLVDRELRFRRMQNHSGEHLISGTVKKLFSFDNVGFHIGRDYMTLDFSGELSAEDIEIVELEANKAVWQNLPVISSLPSDKELETLEYRSKKELTGQVRIISVAGVDVCACCAPHVGFTGEIGCIKIIDSMRHRGGSRLTAVCGIDALFDYRSRFRETLDISHLLSAKQGQLAAALKLRMAEIDELKSDLKAAKLDRLADIISRLKNTEGNICIFLSGFENNMLRELVNVGKTMCTGVCAAFSGEDGRYDYVIGSLGVDLNSFRDEINSAISGKGGGSPNMIQGSSCGDRASIEKYFLRRSF